MRVAGSLGMHYGARHAADSVGAGMTTEGGSRIHERWAQLRFSVIGHLLAAPPAAGTLRSEFAEARRAAVAPSEHRRAGALRGLDDRTLAVPRPT